MCCFRPTNLRPLPADCRLLTPPNVRALSLNAPRDGAQLLPGQGIIVYMGRVHAHSEDFSSDSVRLARMPHNAALCLQWQLAGLLCGC